MNNLNFTILNDFAKIPQGEEFSIRAMLTAEGFLDEELKKTAKPLNLAFVLDRSGSMGGSKLAYVKNAVLYVVSQLNEEDQISLTVFDDRVDVLVPQTRVGDLQGFTGIVEQLIPRGTTNLHDGYKQGIDLLRDNPCEGKISRVLLLTDGLANMGITDTRTISIMAGVMSEESITTTTIGVGADYNESLLGQIAKNGRGGAYFIEKPSDAEAVFAEELTSLKQLVATDLKVFVKPAIDGIKFSQLNSYKVSDQSSFVVGDVYAGQAKHFVIEMLLPACDLSKELTVAELELSWLPVDKKQDRIKTKKYPVTVDVVSKRAFARVEPNRQVTLEAAFLAIARANRKAIELSDQREFTEAAYMLNGVADHIEELGLNDPTLNQEIQDIRRRAKRLQTEREQYYSAMERKRMYYEDDLSSKGQRHKMMSMKARRIVSPDTNRQNSTFEFPCYQVDGHILAEIGNERVLLDTGAQFSFGSLPSINLGGKEFSLRRNFVGKDIDKIGQLIGTRISILVGYDILRQLNYKIDLNKGIFSSTDSNLNGSKNILEITTTMGLPVVTVNIDGQPQRMFFDTGARISYLHSSIFQDHTSMGTRTDFYPGLGEFETEVTILGVDLPGSSLGVLFGVLPRGLEKIIEAAGVKGILGSELLTRYKIRCLGPKNKVELYPYND
jgi:uncharacterized protein YegL